LNRYNWEEILNRRMLICVGTGFVSGLPLYLLTQLVPAWFRLEEVSLTAISFFTLIGLPYTFKFLWSPLLERYTLPVLGRRRGWMLATQLALIVTIGSLGFWQPQADLLMIAAVALGVAAFSATQDIVLDAYRREILGTEGELAMGNTIHVQAYRVSGLVPGSLGLILVGTVSWQVNFQIMAAFMLVGVGLTLLVKEPPAPAVVPATLKEAVILPFQEFFTRRALGPALAVLAFMVLYKFGDNFATVLATPFYIDMGFSPEQIGLIAKNAALWPSIIGGVLGGLIIVKIGINKALWAFGVVQIVTIGGFVWLSMVGANPWVLAIVIAGEYLGVGLGTAASVAFIARETSKLAVATQFAMFTALASLPRTLAAPLVGPIVESFGWTNLFYLSLVLAIPGMVLLLWVAPWNAPSDEPSPSMTPQSPRR
jgi:PAT family beta-lactamase induction signal transducer AmpG